MTQTILIGWINITDMKDQFLKLAGVKSDKEFYKLFPDEASFMAKYGKQIKKLNLGDSLSKLAGNNAFATGVQSAGNIIGGIQQMKDEKQMMLGAQQMQGVSDIALQASMTRPEQVEKKYVRPEDNMNTGEEFFPVYGVGTTLAKNGTKIGYGQNGFLANLGNKDFMKFNKSGQQTDIFNFAEQGGGDMLSKVTSGIGSPKGYGVSGAGKIGGGIGAIAGMLLGGPVGATLGKAGGQLFGNFVDGEAEKTEKANEAIADNIQKMTLNQGAQSLQNQNYAFMEDGGNINPQIATRLEGIPLTRLFAPDPIMDTSRASNKLKKAQKGLSFIYKQPEGTYISGGDSPEDKARQAEQMKKYGASFVPQSQINSFMENWDKHRGSVRDVYEKFTNVNPEDFKNMSMEDIWKERFNAKKLNSEKYGNVRDEHHLANKQIMTDQIRGMRSNYLPEEDTLYNFYNAQKDSLETSYRNFDKISKEYMLQKEKESGLSQLELDAKYKKLFKLRAGGEIKRSALNGAVQTTWGGGIKSLSYNHHMPGTGETIEFVGNSHDTYDPKSKQTGIGVKYGNNNQNSYTDYAEYGTEQADANVEVEREPAAELIDPTTGEKNLTVYGNLKIPNYGVEMLGDPKAKGKKFKNYVSDLTRVENSQNKIMEKSIKELDSISEFDPYDKLSFASYKSNMLGANMKLKDIADKKIKAANLQSAINDTAEEYGLVADDLAKGKIKKARMGASILKKAQNGIVTDADYDKAMKLYEEGKFEEFQKLGMQLFPDYVKSLGTPTVSGKFDDNIEGPRTKALKEYFQKTRERDPSVVPDNISVDLPELPDYGTVDDNIDKALEYFKSQSRESSGNNYPEVISRNKDRIYDAVANVANEMYPFLRPSNARPLDPRQLAGEMYALSTNQVEPVQAQTFQPDLSVPYDISLQDQLNANQADYRAAQRMMGYNPAAQSLLNAQKYQANQQVLGEQFRMNQDMRDRVFAENRNMLNQANLQNLGILDQQYGRQQEALSKTKATTQAALNSISAKYLQNQAENRTLQTYENLYNYRFDPRFRAMNMNPLAQFNLEGSGPTSSQMQEMFREYEKQNPEKFKKDSGYRKNGGLVKAIKSM